jgi:cysteinyl-tRNA synthetase
MIEIIKRMEERGYTYETDQAIYFDVTKVPDYTIFTGQKLEEKNVGVREEVGVDPDKRNPADFVLWMKKVGKYEDHLMNWPSPWGDGFPGWHIECSAMGTAILGENFDIHTGGIDHIPVHHANERAQNIGAFGHPVVKYWVHNEWLVNKDNEKLSKSKGADTLPEVLELGYDPMDVRYLFISVGYRVKMNFSLEALDGARSSRLALEKKVLELGEKKGNLLPKYVEAFKKELENNLNISGVLALVNEMLKADEKDEDKLATILDFDRVLGLGLDDIKKDEGYSEGGSATLDRLLKERLEARENKDYVKADTIRDEIAELGYKVIDGPDGQSVEKI